jgi:hypothetical protein
MDETQLAWALADLARAYLSPAERHDVHIAIGIGIGEMMAAICSLSAVLAREELALPAEIVEPFTDWLDAYVGSPEEARLRELKPRPRLRQSPDVGPPTLTSSVWISLQPLCERSDSRST